MLGLHRDDGWSSLEIVWRPLFPLFRCSGGVSHPLGVSKVLHGVPSRTCPCETYAYFVLYRVYWLQRSFVVHRARNLACDQLVLCYAMSCLFFLTVYRFSFVSWIAFVNYDSSVEMTVNQVVNSRLAGSQDESTDVVMKQKQLIGEIKPLVKKARTWPACSGYSSDGISSGGGREWCCARATFWFHGQWHLASWILLVLLYLK